MAQKDLKLLWGSNTKMNGSSKPAIVDGKAYFAIVDGDTKYPDTAAPANEAFIYFDKDNTRYNVVAKRAIFDALGNKINSTYATDIESSGNTMSLFSADGGEAIDTATIINSVALGQGTTHNGSTYHIKATINGIAGNDYALVAASSSKAGIITTGTQTIAGSKTFSGVTKFTNNTASSSSATGAVVITGGLGVGGNIYGGAAANIATTLTTGGAASIGGDLTVVGQDIYFGNTANKIISLRANTEGTGFKIENKKAASFLMQLVTDAASSTGIEFQRGTNSSWKIINNSGHLQFQNNYTTTSGTYFDVLKLEYNTGSATLKGKLTAQHLDIGHNSSDVTYLSLNRAGFNYIRTPNEGGIIAFIVNGQLPGEDTAELIILDGHVTPGSTNVTSLGSSSKNWSNTHTRGLTSADTLSIASAASKAITFTQGTTQVGQFDTAGSLKIVNNIYPAVTNTKTLGTSSVYWNHVYSTNFTGTTFTGTTFTGNAATATKSYVTNTALPSSGSSKRLILFSTGTDSNQSARNSDYHYFYDTATTTDMCVGNASIRGGLTLWDGSNHYVYIHPEALAANRTITISDHGGTMMTSGNYTQWASPSTHTHNVTISHTPAGTISRPTFTGTTNQETSANAGYSTVASSGHTHSYNRVSSVSAHSLTTSSYTSGANSGSGVAFYAYSGSSKPSLTASIASKCLTVTFTSPATSAYTAAPNSHTHSYTRVSSIANHTVSTSSYTSGTPSATTDVASNGHKHTYTATGTISTPTFTGTAYSTTVTTTTQNA